MTGAIGLSAVALALAAGVAAAEEVAICFNYGCNERAVVRYSSVEIGQVEDQFVHADSPEAEGATAGRTSTTMMGPAGWTASTTRPTRRRICG